MNNEIAIEVENLKIRYRCLHSVSLKKSIFHWKKSKKDVFEAVKGISFQIKKGEIIVLPPRKKVKRKYCILKTSLL